MAHWEISVHYEFWIGTNYFTLAISDDLLFLSNEPAYSLWNGPSESEVISSSNTAFNKQIYQWQTLKDDLAEKDVTPQDFE